MVRKFLGRIKRKLLHRPPRVPSFSTPLTELEDVSSLIRKLRPVQTDHPLIRMGAAGDGGYLIPDDLEGIRTCFSPGVDRVSEFERDCADRGMSVFLADASVEAPAEANDRFHFSQKYLGAMNDETHMTLDSWVMASLEVMESDLLLQMDIETAEYEVLLSASDELLQKFRILVIEFHWLDMLWSKPFFQIASRVFEKLLKTHACVHIHPNNCRNAFEKDRIGIPPMMEFTFLRHDRVHNPKPANSFPHPLDADNVEICVPVPLPEFWYRDPA